MTAMPDAALLRMDVQVVSIVERSADAADE